MDKLQRLQFRLVPLATLCLSSCFGGYDVKSLLENNTGYLTQMEIAEVRQITHENLWNVTRTSNSIPTVAVYSFSDLTGQRKSNSQFALFSTAVTMSPYALLVRALKHAGQGSFFRVVERVGLDHLTKERQLIRSTRDSLRESEDMLPLLFAGLIMEGGVIGYDTNLKSGGTGARYLGIGASKQYREDTVTVSLRTVSVSTGEILMEVLITKTILSVAVNQDVFRFIEMGTELVEVENGVTKNESVTIALQKAIETGVYETILEGNRRGYWSVVNGDNDETSGGKP